MGFFNFGKTDNSWLEEIILPYDIAKALYICKKNHAMPMLINSSLDKYLNIGSSKCKKVVDALMNGTLKVKLENGDIVQSKEIDFGITGKEALSEYTPYIDLIVNLDKYGKN
jgi:hypothetical protein